MPKVGIRSTSYCFRTLDKICANIPLLRQRVKMWLLFNQTRKNQAEHEGLVTRVYTLWNRNVFISMGTPWFRFSPFQNKCVQFCSLQNWDRLTKNRQTRQINKNKCMRRPRVYSAPLCGLCGVRNATAAGICSFCAKLWSLSITASG